MKLIQFERIRETSKQSYQDECRNDGRLRRLRLIKSVLFWLFILSTIPIFKGYSFTWIVGPVFILIIDIIVVLIINKGRQAIKQRYLYL